MPLLLAGGVCCCAAGFGPGVELVAGFAGAGVAAGAFEAEAGVAMGVGFVAGGAAAEVAVLAGVALSVELDFFEALDFFVVEPDESALAAVDLPASAPVADSAGEDFLELLLDFDFVELSAVFSVLEAAESAFVDFDFDFDFEVLAAEESASFESEDSVESAAESDFLDFDLDLGFALGVLDSV
jgi:hypothetical protein